MKRCRYTFGGRSKVVMGDRRTRGVLFYVQPPVAACETWSSQTDNEAREGDDNKRRLDLSANTLGSSERGDENVGWTEVWNTETRSLCRRPFDQDALTG